MEPKPAQNKIDEALSVTPFEVSKLLRSMAENKASDPTRPDGCPMDVCWILLKIFFLVLDDLTEILNELPESMSSSCYGANTKNQDAKPLLLSSKRPISLLSMNYKLLAKILCSKCTQTLSMTIAETQTRCFLGRSIQDNTLLLQAKLSFMPFLYLVPVHSRPHARVQSSVQSPL